MDWIDFKKRKPEDCAFVLCYNINQDTNVVIGLYSKFYDRFYIKSIEDDSNMITHWMPLPEPPKNK